MGQKHSPHMATEAGSTATMSAILRIDLVVRSDWWILQSPEPTSSSRLAPGDFLLSANGKNILKSHKIHISKSYSYHGKGKEESGMSKRIHLNVGGMTCINCQVKIENGLNAAEGVMEASVSFSKGTADILYDESRRRVSDEYKPLTGRLIWQDDLVIDFEKATVRKKGSPLSLTKSEWKILSSMASYPKKVFTRDELMEITFGGDADSFDRVIDTHIKNLRKKLESDPRNPVYIKTIHGIGYKFGGDEN